MNTVIIERGVYVTGFIEVFDGDMWSQVETQERVPVIELGEWQGYTYAVNILSDLPVRWWDTGDMVTITEEEQDLL